MTLPRHMPALVMIASAETIVWAGLFYFFPITLLRWEADFGWDRGEVALALTLALGVSALASPLVGRLIDAGLSRYTLPGSAALGGVLLFALSQTESQPVFFLIWALIGLACAGCLYDPCFSFLTRVRGAHARGAITTVTLIAGFASTICFPIADTIAEAEGWRTGAQAFAAAILILAVPLFWVSTRMLDREERISPKPATRTQQQAAMIARKRPEFWLLALAFPALALTHGMVISHIMPLLGDKGAGAQAVPAASLIGPMQVLGRIGMTLLGARRSATSLTLIAFAGIALACGILFFGQGLPPVFAFVTVLGACYGVMSITKPLVIADILGREGFGAISGALALPFIAMTAAAPFVAVLLWRAMGYDLVIAVGAALAGIGLIALIAAGRVTR